MNDVTPQGFIKPDILGDEDLWGQDTNANWDLLDSQVTDLQSGLALRVRKSGDTMTGGLTVIEPTAPGMATSKNYVDTQLAGLPATATPLMDGAASVGASARLAREDHVHPSDVSRYAASNPSNYQSDSQVAASIAGQVANYVPLTQRAAANGVATLDAGGRIPTAQLPSSATGTLSYKGGWNASTNTPTMTSGALVGGVAAPTGDYYVVTVAGTTSVDGIASWSAGDWISSNGTIWQRVQNSSTPYLPLTGGTLSGPVTGPTYQFLDGTKILTGGTTPDLPPFTIEDPSYNIALYLDSAATLWGYGANFTVGTFATLNATTLNLTNPPTFSALYLTSLTVSGDSWAALTAQPDLVTIEAQDSAGNIVAGFSADGYLNVVGIKAAQGIQIAGAAIGGSAVASDALDVRSAPYNAVGDGVEAFCSATTSGTSLTIQTYAGNVTLTQLDANTAQLVIVPVNNSGIAFQPYDVGKVLYLVVGSYTLQATITRFMDSTTVRLAAPGITAQTSQPATATWPCFQSGDVGKSIVIDGQGRFQIWVNDATKTPDPLPYGQSAFITTISAVASAVQATLASAPPFAWTAMPTRIRWGTNDAAAIVAAAQAAFAAQKRKLYFSGDGRLYLLLGMVATDAARPQYVTPQGGEAAAAMNGMLWVGDNARVFCCDSSGLPQANHVAQIGSDTTKIADKRIFGRASFPRCAKLTTINLLITGDSQSLYAPQNQAQAWGQAHQFVQAFKKANPGKTINLYHVGIGGTTYAMLDDPAYLITDAYSQTAGWIVPRPIVGSVPWYSFTANVNQTATSGTAPIVPDLVCIFDNGGNDADSMDGPSMASFINRVRNPALHSDGNGPTDVVLMTDCLTTLNVSSLGNGSGSVPPNTGTRLWVNDYASGLIRSTASVRGFGCYDLYGQVQRACFAMDHMHRALRTVPGFTATGSPTVPIGLPCRCLDFSLWLSFPGSNDAAVWAAMQQIDVQISQQYGNRLMLRRGANGHLWAGVASYGGTTPTICTIASGSTALAVAAPTSASVIFSAQSWWQLYVSAGFTFDASMVGQQVILPTGDRARAQRNFIRGYVDAANVTLNHQTYSGLSYVGQSGAMTIGGVHFMAQDADAQADVVIFYADGTIFNTQIVGFTDSAHVTLRDPAPQALSAASRPVFVGRMGTKWFDTGLNLAGFTAATNSYAIDVSRDTLVLGFKEPSKILVTQLADVPIERFGGTFYPVITPAASQSVAIDHYYIDEHRPFMPHATPWEVRGIKDGGDLNFYLGGFGGHPASRIMTDVLDSFLANQDLGTA